MNCSWELSWKLPEYLLECLGKWLEEVEKIWRFGINKSENLKNE